MTMSNQKMKRWICATVEYKPLAPPAGGLNQLVTSITNCSTGSELAHAQKLRRNAFCLRLLCRRYLTLSFVCYCASPTSRALFGSRMASVTEPSRSSVDRLADQIRGRNMGREMG
jgi:hypothetical protein